MGCHDVLCDIIFTMKIMFICKKHYKELMEEFKKTNPPAAVNGVLENPDIMYNLIGYLGEPYRIEIKPNLKKIKILSLPKFEMRMPAPELDIEPPKSYRPWIHSFIT